VGVTVTWAGLALGYYSRYPIGFYITTIAFCAYVLATAAARR
jgi:zinc/manganese transport system permease protein